MNLSKHKKLFNAMYETLHKLEEASKERLYVHTNISGYMYLLSTSGMIIEQAPDVTTLHARMMNILRTYENQTKQEGLSK